MHVTEQQKTCLSPFCFFDALPAKIASNFRLKISSLETLPIRHTFSSFNAKTTTHKPNVRKMNKVKQFKDAMIK